MIRIFSIAVILFAINAAPVKAQYRTGSDELDSSLTRMDAKASVNFSAFKADLSTSYHISDSKINHLSVEIGMSAGDIYMTVRIARIISVHIDKVVEVYQANRGKGWGVIAKELGIKPGSPEFHALKGNTHKKGKGSAKSNNPKGKKKG